MNSQPSAALGSASMDPTNLRVKNEKLINSAAADVYYFGERLHLSCTRRLFFLS